MACDKAFISNIMLLIVVGSSVACGGQEEVPDTPSRSPIELSPAPKSSCTALWPELAELIPGRTTQAEVTAAWGEPDTTYALPSFLTPEWLPELENDQPGYMLPSGHAVQVFFTENHLSMALITPPTALPIDPVARDILGREDFADVVQTRDGVFSLFYWSSDEGRVVRIAMARHMMVLMTACGLVDGLTPEAMGITKPGA